MRVLLGLLAALAFAGEAGAQAAPLTLNRLYDMPVAEAGSAVLGPGPEVFVERSPYNTMPQNFVMNTWGVFRMTFFTKAERVGPHTCAVVEGGANFDMRPAPDATAEEKAAIEKLPAGQRPLRQTYFDRGPVYFVAGPARPVPAKPGERPVPLNAEALAADSCANPVSARGLGVSPFPLLFSATSPEDAVAEVGRLYAVIGAARRKGPLPFIFKDDCTRRRGCPDTRRQLSKLRARGLSEVSSIPCDGYRLEGSTCISFRIDDPALPSDQHWSVMMGLGKDGKVHTVRFGAYSDPVI